MRWVFSAINKKLNFKVLQVDALDATDRWLDISSTRMVDSIKDSTIYQRSYRFHQTKSRVYLLRSGIFDVEFDCIPQTAPGESRTLNVQKKINSYKHTAACKTKVKQISSPKNSKHTPKVSINPSATPTWEPPPS